jgi:hypothetical protein
VEKAERENDNDESGREDYEDTAHGGLYNGLLRGPDVQVGKAIVVPPTVHALKPLIDALPRC